MNWCHDSAFTLPLRYGFCKEADWPKFCEDFGLHLPYIAHDHSDATAHFITSGEGHKVVVVCLRPRNKISSIQIAGLLIHEAVHIFQKCMADLGETRPGEEIEAYLIQNISQNLLQEYHYAQSDSPTN